jgi:hypothetical protein
LAGIVTAVILSSVALARKTCKDMMCKEDPCGGKSCPIECIEVCIVPFTVPNFPTIPWEIHPRYECPSVDDLDDNCSIVRYKKEDGDDDDDRPVYHFLAEGKFQPDLTQYFLESINTYPNQTRAFLNGVLGGFNITLP